MMHLARTRTALSPARAVARSIARRSFLAVARMPVKRSERLWAVHQVDIVARPFREDGAQDEGPPGGHAASTHHSGTARLFEGAR